MNSDVKTHIYLICWRKEANMINLKLQLRIYVTHSLPHVLSHWSLLDPKTSGMNVGSKLSNMNLCSDNNVGGNSFVQLLDKQEWWCGLPGCQSTSCWIHEKPKLLLWDFTGARRQNRAPEPQRWGTQNSKKNMDSHTSKNQTEILWFKTGIIE